MKKEFVSFEKDMVTSIIHPEDPYQMDWVKEGRCWGAVQSKVKLSVDHKKEHSKNCLRESFLFTNETSEPIYTQISDITIEIPFPDEYQTAHISETKRCHTHLWCGESSSYVLGLRMNGEGPHLGLILNKGSIVKYSVEREHSNLSNDRGIFFLHPAPTCILPQETMIVSWDLYWVKNREEFEALRMTYENQIGVTLNQYVQLGVEECSGQVSFSSMANLAPNDISLEIDGKTVSLIHQNNQARFNLVLPQGEYKGTIRYGEYTSHFTCLKYPTFEELLERRVGFITRKQQHHDLNFPPLNGAFLCYDNEEGHQYYNIINDYNGGRERVGMGVLLARYLQRHEIPYVRQSLLQFVEYVIRELFDSRTGQVYNDYNHNEFFRLYNYPWIIQLFEETYQVTQDKKYVGYMRLALERYYEEGGHEFYPIGWYFAKWIRLIGSLHGESVQKHLTNLVRNHCEKLIENDLEYPESEVRYEQSIIAPAVSCLLEMYDLTEEERYFIEAKKHLRLLELFEGYQPDHHLYNTAIRHWDGYWFGKRRLLGDTFPHYWSALNGMNYLKFYQITGDSSWKKRANYSIRGCLSLILPNGEGSCAYLYPYSINGINGEFYDPMANDQDWILVFMDIFMEKE